MFTRIKRMIRAIKIHRIRRARDERIRKEFEDMLDGIAMLCRRTAKEHIGFVRTLPLEIAQKNTTIMSVRQRLDRIGSRMETAGGALDHLTAEYILAMMQGKFRDAAYTATKCIAAWIMYASNASYLHTTSSREMRGMIGSERACRKESRHEA